MLLPLPAIESGVRFADEVELGIRSFTIEDDSTLSQQVGLSFEQQLRGEHEGDNEDVVDDDEGDTGNDCVELIVDELLCCCCWSNCCWCICSCCPFLLSVHSLSSSVTAARSLGVGAARAEGETSSV